MEQATSLIPGQSAQPARDLSGVRHPGGARQIKPEHFKTGLSGRRQAAGPRFNPSCFSHPLSADGFTAVAADPKNRQFWIDHCKASRRVSAYFGEQLVRLR
ncbi:L-rhamnose isomerase [Shigella flexneri]